MINNRQCYSPYGYRSNSRALSSLLGFNGERPETLTGHYVLGNGYRAYNPVLMRFNSPDSLSPFGAGGVNAYAYCLGDPVNRNDQTGHVSFAVLVKAVIRFKALRTSKLVSKLPDLVERKIHSYLSSADLVALASTSSGMKSKVYGGLRSLNYLDSSALINVEAVQLARQISLGDTQGHLSFQVHRNDEIMHAVYSGAVNDNEPGKSYLLSRFVQRRRYLNDEYSIEANNRIRQSKVDSKKKNYGEDVQSDTSYDSDDSYRP